VEVQNPDVQVFGIRPRVQRGIRLQAKRGSCQGCTAFALGFETMAHELTAHLAFSSKDGSLGLLLNDPKLYRNLESTTYKLNILLDDFRTHPKRYVNVSVFGKKDKNQPLTAPLKDDSSSQSLPKK